MSRSPLIVVMILLALMWAGVLVVNISSLSTSHRQFRELLVSCDRLSAAHQRQIEALQKEVAAQDRLVDVQRQRITQLETR